MLAASESGLLGGASRMRGTRGGSCHVVRTFSQPLEIPPPAADPALLALAALDHLEDRTVPSTIQWSGGPTGTGTNWLEPTNWVGGAVPGANDDAVIAALGQSGSAYVPIGGLANVDLRTYSAGVLYPAAPTTLTVGGIAFDMSSYGATPNTLGAIQAPPGASTFTISTNVTAPTVVYTLMNSQFGSIGADIATIEFVGAHGADATFDLVEGTNIRDHFNDGYNNVIAPGTPSATFVGSNGDTVRLDRQTFVLPSSFANDTLSQIIFTGHGDDFGGNAFLAAVTVGDPGPEITLPDSTTVHSATIDRPLRMTGGTLTVGAATSHFSDLIQDGGTLTPLDGATLAGSVIEGSGTLTNPTGITLTVADTTVNAPWSTMAPLSLSERTRSPAG